MAREKLRKMPKRQHTLLTGGVRVGEGVGIVGVENYEIYIFHKNQKVGLGTVENGLAASAFPPEGLKKESYVEGDTFKKLQKLTSGPSDPSPSAFTGPNNEIN